MHRVCTYSYYETLLVVYVWLFSCARIQHVLTWLNPREKNITRQSDQVSRYFKWKAYHMKQV